MEIFICDSGSFAMEIFTILSGWQEKDCLIRQASAEDCLDAIGESRLVVCCSDRYESQLLSSLEERAFAGCFILLAVVYAGDEVVIGPIVRKGSTCCLDCLNRRRLQHAPHPEVLEAIYAHYSNEAVFAPEGFLPSVAAFAAGEVVRRVQLLNEIPDEHVCTLNIFTSSCSYDDCQGIHRCMKCGRVVEDWPTELNDYISGIYAAKLRAETQ